MVWDVQAKHISILCFTRTLDDKKKIVVSTFCFYRLSTFNVSNLPCFSPPRNPETHIHSIHVTPRDSTVSSQIARFPRMWRWCTGQLGKRRVRFGKGTMNHFIQILSFTFFQATLKATWHIFVELGFPICSTNVPLQHLFSHPSASTSLTNTEAYPRLPSAAFPKAASSSAWTQLGDPCWGRTMGFLPFRLGDICHT